jgi:cold shock CspA family protein
MGRSQESFQKKEVRNKKAKKRKEKAKKRLERKEQGKDSFDDMIAYVDENGNIVDTPPDEDQKTEVNQEDIEVSVPKDDPSLKNDPVKTGIVTFFNDSKGYGFIRESETKQSVFVHINNVAETLKENNKVSFEIEKGPKGLTAIKVKLVK